MTLEQLLALKTLLLQLQKTWNISGHNEFALEFAVVQGLLDDAIDEIIK